MIITETERLLLRPIHARDLDALADLFAHPEVMEFSLGVASRDETREWIDRQRKSYHELGFGQWAVVVKEEREVAGFCGISPRLIDEQEEMEIGYRLRRQFWGRGIATEAARAVRRYAAEIMTLDRVISIIEPANVRSVRVAEKNDMHHAWDTTYHDRPVRIYLWEKRGDRSIS